MELYENLKLNQEVSLLWAYTIEIKWTSLNKIKSILKKKYKLLFKKVSIFPRKYNLHL